MDKNGCMSRINFIFQMFPWGVITVALHPWSSWIKIFFFSLHGLEWLEHGQKQSWGLLHIWDAQWIIGQWGSALRKSFETMGVFVGFSEGVTFIFLIWGFKVWGKIILVLKKSLRILNCCLYSGKMGFIAIFFESSKAKTRMSLCQMDVRHCRNSCWLSGSSNCWSSNVCAALGIGWAVGSTTVNKGTLCTWWLKFGLTAEAHNRYHSQLLILLFGEGLEFISVPLLGLVHWAGGVAISLPCWNDHFHQ